MTIPNTHPAVEKLSRLRMENTAFGNMLTKFRGASTYFIEDIQNPLYDTTIPRMASFKNNLEEVMESVINQTTKEYISTPEEGISDEQITAELRRVLVDSAGGKYMEQVVRMESAELELPDCKIAPENHLWFMMSKCEDLFAKDVLGMIKDRYIKNTGIYTNKPDFDPITCLYQTLNCLGNEIFQQNFDNNDIRFNNDRQIS
jgi:hypothetical protein